MMFCLIFICFPSFELFHNKRMTPNSEKYVVFHVEFMYI